jgi:hypothetical protein
MVHGITHATTIATKIAARAIPARHASHTAPSGTKKSITGRVSIAAAVSTAPPTIALRASAGAEGERREQRFGEDVCRHRDERRVDGRDGGGDRGRTGAGGATRDRGDQPDSDGAEKRLSDLHATRCVLDGLGEMKRREKHGIPRRTTDPLSCSWRGLIRRIGEAIAPRDAPAEREVLALVVRQRPLAPVRERKAKAQHERQQDAACEERTAKRSGKTAHVSADRDRQWCITRGNRSQPLPGTRVTHGALPTPRSRSLHTRSCVY